MTLAAIAEEHPCRFAAVRGDVVVADQRLVDLPPAEQISRGKELLSMLRPFDADVENSPPSNKDRKREGDEVLEMAMSVKHTFIEMIATPKANQRSRSFTDSALLCEVDANPARLSDASTEGNSDEEMVTVPSSDTASLADWASPSWGPSSDRFYVNEPSEDRCPMAPPTELTTNDAFCWGMLPNATWGLSYLPDSCIAEWSNPDSALGSHQAASSRTQAFVDNDDTLHAEECNTTIMLRNIPSSFTRQSLIETLEDEGFEGSYDFVYVPMDFGQRVCLGYAFVNFVAESDAARCWQVFDGFADWGASVEKVCQVMWSSPHQGLAALIERYRNSPVMHENMPDEWKPAHFVDGTRAPFPPPTKYIKAPQLKNRKGKTDKA